MFQYFHNLGVRIDALWKERGRDDLAFREVATHALWDQPPSKSVTYREAVRMGILHDPLPHQMDLGASFGQPPLTVYHQHDFRIELLFWTTGLPGIHHHAFSGAFHVMHGSSLHTEWEFDAARKLAHRLLSGKLRLKATEILRTGDVRPITAGSSYIHSTYHLDRPSVSVVVRTNQEIEHSPQYTYLPPGIAYARIDDDPSAKRRRQLMRMLSSVGHHRELADVAVEYLENTDGHAAFALLMQLPSLFPDARIQDRVLRAAQTRHAELLEHCLPALEELQRSDRIGKLKKSIANPDLQFFVAVLWNVPDRAAILDLVRVRYPRRDPEDRISLFLHELKDLGVIREARVPEHHWLLRALFAG